MEKSIVGVATIWMAAVVSAALLIYKVNRPVGDSTVSSPAPACPPAEVAGAQTDDSVVDTEEPAVLVLPVITIVGSHRGTAEMQPADDLTPPAPAP
jgi:hypothetical protein